MQLSDLRVGARLGCAFGVLLLLMLGMGLYALNKVEQVQASVVDLSGNWLPSTQQLAGVNEALKSERVVKYLETNGYTSVGGAPEALQQRVDDAIALWGPLVKKAGIAAK